MTVAEFPPRAVVLRPRDRAPWWTTTPSPVLVAAGLTGVALVIRSVGLIHSYEMWVDEMLYADLGASLSRGEMPRLADGPFFLHPPGFFLIEAGVIRLLGIPTGDALALAFDLRWLTAVLGALTVGLVFLLIRRLAGTRLAAWGALVLALEPFVLRLNSRVFLETLAELMLVAGLLVIVLHVQAGAGGSAGSGAQRRDARGGRRRQPTVRLLTGGLLLGYAVVTKDAFAFFAVMPVVLAVVWRRTLSLREVAVVVVGAVVPYGLYLTVVASTGYLGQLIRAKSAGFLRLIGTEDITGFNAPGAPSLLGRLLEQATQYGTSYVILLLCPLAGLVASLSTRPEHRLVGLTASCTGAYGVYMVTFGAAEEQYAYPIMIAGVVALAVVTRLALDRKPTLRTATVSMLVLFLVAEVALGARQVSTRDDGLLTFRTWAAENLPASAKVGVTNGASTYAYADDPRFGAWPDAAALQANGAQYVLTFDQPTRQGYTLATPQFLDWLEINATPVFRTTGPTNGETVLWFIDAQTLAATVPAGGQAPASAPTDGTTPAPAPAAGRESAPTGNEE